MTSAIKKLPLDVLKAMRSAGYDAEAIRKVSAKLRKPDTRIVFDKKTIKRIEAEVSRSGVAVVTAKTVFSMGGYQARVKGGNRLATFRHGPKLATKANHNHKTPADVASSLAHSAHVTGA